jgi:hypothetical protein
LLQPSGDNIGGIRQHTSAYVSIRQKRRWRHQRCAAARIRQHTSAYVSKRQHTSAYVSIRQHTQHLRRRILAPTLWRQYRGPRGCLQGVCASAYVSIRSASSIYRGPRGCLQGVGPRDGLRIHRRTVRRIRNGCNRRVAGVCDVERRSVDLPQHTSAYVSIRQHTSAYVSIRQHTSAYVSIRQHTSAHVNIRQHTSAYVSIRQHTSAYASIRVDLRLIVGELGLRAVERVYDLQHTFGR